MKGNRNNYKLTTPMADFRSSVRAVMQRLCSGIVAEAVVSDHIVNFEVRYAGRKYNVRIFDVEALTRQSGFGG